MFEIYMNIPRPPRCRAAGTWPPGSRAAGTYLQKNRQKITPRSLEDRPPGSGAASPPGRPAQGRPAPSINAAVSQLSAWSRATRTPSRSNQLINQHASSAGNKSLFFLKDIAGNKSLTTNQWYYSTKWNLFTKLFAWMGCKSRDEFNEPT